MAEILELLGQQFKILMINILRAIWGKVDNLQEQLSQESSKLETLRKHWKKMLEIKNTVTEMKSAFDGLHNRLNMAKKRTIALKGRSKCTDCLCVLDTALSSDEQDKRPVSF